MTTREEQRSAGDDPHADPVVLSASTIALVDALADESSLLGRLRVPLDRVRARWARIAGLALTSPGSREALAEALEEAARAGRARLPSGKKLWDRNPAPPLPLWVEIADRPEATTARATLRSHIWHPRLTWLRRRPLTDAQFAQLKDVNRWLAATDGTEVPVLPFRERSFEITRDEKALEALLDSRLAGEGPDALNLELFTAEALPLPTATARVGDRDVAEGGVVLMVENLHTFWTLTRALRARREHGHLHDIAWTAYGAGWQAPGAVRALPELLDVPGERLRLRYFGDLDAVGLDIAIHAIEVAAQAGFAEASTAADLYRMLLSLDQPTPGGDAVEWEETRRLAGVLAEDLRDRATNLMVAGKRMAQEQLTATLLPKLR